MAIPFNDLQPLDRELRPEIDIVMRRILDRGNYILGPELEAFEVEFAAYVGAGHAVGVATGTDAIELALRACGIGRGDEVITVSHTAVATVCAIERAGATPVMVDIDPDSFCINVEAAEAAITTRTRALLPVHIYGCPADLDGLRQLADRHKLLLVEDCAQAHGARYGGRRVGSIGDVAAFSFYPTKNLGAYGDGGAVVTSNADVAARVRSLRNYGQAERYHHVEAGMNSRLDELQAAVLRAKLAHLDDLNNRRRTTASIYGRNLAGVVVPSEPPGRDHVYHLYVVRHPWRDRLAGSLRERGVGTAVHYPVPVHLQPAYEHLGAAAGSLPETERAAREVLSLPMYIGLTVEQTTEVATAVSGEAGQ